MSPVELLPVPGGSFVLRARGSELLILNQHVAALKKLQAAKDFAGYFTTEALINRPARKLFEAWLRKDAELWRKIYNYVHKEADLSEMESTEASAPVKVKEDKAKTEKTKTEPVKAKKTEVAAKVEKAEKSEKKDKSEAKSVATKVEKSSKDKDKKESKSSAASKKPAAKSAKEKLEPAKAAKTVKKESAPKKKTAATKAKKK